MFPFDVFFSCEVVDLTDHAMKVCWAREVTFWVRRSDMHFLGDISNIGDRGKLVMREGWEGRDGVFALFAAMPVRREEEAR